MKIILFAARDASILTAYRAAFDFGGVVGLKRPDLRSRSRRSGLLSPTSTSIQVRTFRYAGFAALRQDVAEMKRDVGDLKRVTSSKHSTESANAAV